MAGRYLLIILLIASFGLANAAVAASEPNKTAAQVAQNKNNDPKTPRASSKKRKAHPIAHRLVPPPPAYMPSILPELYYQRNVAQNSENETEVLAEKPKNPYSRYFYSRDNEVPKAVQARSGVSTWTSVH